MPARLRLVSSQATQATWSLVLDDRARGASLLIDGRDRAEGCDRAGRQIRCELRGMFPGGHTVELRLPGAILRRSVVIGRSWPERPVLVRVRSIDDAKEAAEAGADAVVGDESLGVEALQDIAEVVHAKSARLFVDGRPELVETAGADGVLGRAIPPELLRRFPEARTVAVDAAGTQLLARLVESGPLGDSTQLQRTAGIVEAHGLLAGALALLAPRGAIVDRASFPLIGARKRHAALRGGTGTFLTTEPTRVGFTLSKSGDDVTVLVNAHAEPWSVRPSAPSEPLDLLGSTINGGEVTVRPRDVALLVRAPAPDHTRY